MVRERLDNIPEEEREFPTQPWGGVTDPRLHNPQRFRYLVYGSNIYSREAKLKLTGEGIIDSPTKAQDPSCGDQSIDLYQFPERLNERVSLSMSLVDQDHTGTYGDAGLIIETPKENIAITSPSDVGAWKHDVQMLRNLAIEGQIMSGEQLLAVSGIDSLNEVVVLAKTGRGGVLVLAGFFAKVDGKGKYLDETTAYQMKSHSQRLNLPLVTFCSPYCFRRVYDWTSRDY